MSPIELGDHSRCYTRDIGRNKKGKEREKRLNPMSADNMLNSVAGF